MLGKPVFGNDTACLILEFVELLPLTSGLVPFPVENLPLNPHLPIHTQGHVCLYLKGIHSAADLYARFPDAHPFAHQQCASAPKFE
jgi:hypothetical protein